MNYFIGNKRKTKQKKHIKDVKEMLEKEYLTEEGYKELNGFKTFGKKIYSITCKRVTYGVFYENEFTIVYKERWYFWLLKKLLKIKSKNI